jgi:hypothetical protein
MSYTYCKTCGHKNLYATQVPKFCNNCGETLGAAMGAAIGVVNRKPAADKGGVTRPKRRRPIMEDSEDSSVEFSDVDQLPEINDFKCSASSEGFNRTLKLKDIVDLDELENGEQVEKAPKQKRKRGRPRKRK